MQQSSPVHYTLGELANRVQGQVVGDPEFRVTGLATLESAQAEHLSFVARPKLRPIAERSSAGALLVTRKLATELASFHHIVVPDPYLAYAMVSQLFWQPALESPGVAASAHISDDVELPASVSVGHNAVIESGAIIGESVEIGAGCYIGRHASVGAHTRLRHRVTLYPETVVGSHCLLHAGVVLGADGFGFAPTMQGWEKIAQLGRVIIGDRTEIGANSTIDRGALDDTVIGDDVIIDNLVQIGHNVHLGAGSAMAGQSGIAGSAKVGRRVMVGGQTGIGGHISIADGVQFHGQSMVNKSITEAGSYASGIPVQPAADWRRMVVRLKQLGSLADKINALWRSRDKATKD